MLRLGAAAVAVIALAVGFGRSDRVVTGTVSCSTNSFEISFEPGPRVARRPCPQRLQARREALEQRRNLLRGGHLPRNSASSSAPHARPARTRARDASRP